MVKNGERLNIIPLCGRQNDCDSKDNWNKIKEWSKEVPTFGGKGAVFATSDQKMDCTPLGNRYGGPHWRRTYLVKFKYVPVNDIDNELPMFCGNPLEFIGWLNTIESVFEYCHVIKEKKVKLVSTGLKGRASNFVDTTQS